MFEFQLLEPAFTLPGPSHHCWCGNCHFCCDVHIRLAVARSRVLHSVARFSLRDARWLICSLLVFLFSPLSIQFPFSLYMTSSSSSGKCIHFGAGWSKVRLSAGSYQDLVKPYCHLLTRRTVCERAAGNTPRTQKQTEGNGTRNCGNSVMALQDHCSYKAPTTNHLKKK